MDNKNIAYLEKIFKIVSNGLNCEIEVIDNTYIIYIQNKVMIVYGMDSYPNFLFLDEWDNIIYKDDDVFFYNLIKRISDFMGGINIIIKSKKWAVYEEEI